MKKFSIFFLLTTLLISNIYSQFSLEEAFPNLDFPNIVDLQNAGDGTDRLFAVMQNGVIRAFNNSPDASSSDLFLDISNKVSFGGEKGLLGLAFHPEYEVNGYFYIYYSSNQADESIVARYSVSEENHNQADANSLLILMSIAQPYSNHNGGQVVFGPDGYLYIALGDGGSGGDPQNNAQNLSSLLGKILRIDVDSESNNQNYSIPNDNPFKDNTEGYKEEIYAYGLRNPWRFCFDPINGNLIAADVGQNLWEEINIIKKGENYGWRLMEGEHCFNPESGCNDGTLTLPIWEYYHDQSGGWSITGGQVYRVNEDSPFYGKYIYADYVSGNIWALDYNNSTVKNELLVSSSLNISSFGKDIYGNIYICNYQGTIYQFETPIVDVERNKSELIPNEPILIEKAYPNPFNPTTNIVFRVNTKQNITVNIYDAVGKFITTLFDSLAQPKELYHVEFNTNSFGSLASGIYYYSVESEFYAKTGKVVLLK